MVQVRQYGHLAAYGRALTFVHVQVQVGKKVSEAEEDGEGVCAGGGGWQPQENTTKRQNSRACSTTGGAPLASPLQPLAPSSSGLVIQVRSVLKGSQVCSDVKHADC